MSLPRRVSLLVVSAVVLLGVGCADDDAAQSGPSGTSSSSAGGATGGGGMGGSGSGGAPACPAPAAISDVEDVPGLHIEIAGDTPVASRADLSLAYPSGAPGGALAYSVVPFGTGMQANQAGLATRVALSDDAGASWTYVADVNTPEAVPLPTGAPCPSGETCSAHIVNETPTIVFDGTDPDAMRQWKLFTHRYHVVTTSGGEQQLYYTIGHLAMFSAPLPSGPWSLATPIAGWPGTPFSSTGAKYMPADNPDTSDCGAFGEPGAMVSSNGELRLAFSCIKPPFADPVLDIVMLRSTDHGDTWSYVSTPVKGTDGSCFGGAGKRVNAVDLFTFNGSDYLLFTPEGPDTRHGCAVVKFEGGDATTVQRNAGGALLAERVLNPIFEVGELVQYMGACSYSEGASATGYAMSHLYFTANSPPLVHELVTGIVAP